MQMEKNQRVLLCEDSIEGILSAVHMAYLSRYGHKYITIALKEAYEPALFCEYINVETDPLRADSVAKAIQKKISPEAWERVWMAACSWEPQKTQAIYRFLNLGFVMGGCVCGHLSDEFVLKVFKMHRQVEREGQHLKGFVRFRELSSGILFSKIRPKNQQLYILGGHFSDRFPEENFAIYDEGRHMACLHQAHRPWVITENVHMDAGAFLDVSEAEQRFCDLWKTFFEHIEIRERKNPRLQMQMLPKRFWDNMPEMRP